jgi:hypothetical protein
MRKFLGHILVSLLVAALSSAIFALVLGHTLGSATFLQSAAGKTQLYDQLATTLPATIAGTTATPDQTKSALSTVLNATYIRQQTEALLPQLEKYYTAGGPIPLIDLSDLQTRLTEAGYPVPPELSATLSTPQTITAGPADNQLTTLIRQSQNLQWIAPLVALVLIALIVVLMRERRWITLLQAAAWTTVTLALSAGLLWLIPSFIASSLGASTLKPLEPAIVSFVRSIGNAMARELLWAAAGLAVAALILGIVHGFTKIKSQFVQSSKSTPLNNSKNSDKTVNNI